VRRDEIVFFVDRCLGAHTVPDALRVAGALVEVHGTHPRSPVGDERSDNPCDALAPS